jgi:hypothetical protein
MSNNAANQNVDELLESLYKELSSFKAASEQLAQQAALGNGLTQGWKTVTVEFDVALRSTKDALNEVARNSQALVSKIDQSDAENGKIIKEIVASNKENLERIEKLQAQINHRCDNIEKSLAHNTSLVADLNRAVNSQQIELREKGERFTGAVSDLHTAIERLSQSVDVSVAGIASKIEWVTRLLLVVLATLIVLGLYEMTKKSGLY